MSENLIRLIAWHEERLRELRAQLYNPRPAPTAELRQAPVPTSPPCEVCKRPIAHYRLWGKLYCLPDLPIQKPYTLLAAGDDGISDVVQESHEDFLGRRTTTT